MKNVQLAYVKGLMNETGSEKGEVLLGFPHSPYEVEAFGYKGNLFLKEHIQEPNDLYPFPLIKAVLIAVYTKEEEIVCIKNDVMQLPKPSIQQPKTVYDRE